MLVTDAARDELHVSTRSAWQHVASGQLPIAEVIRGGPGRPLRVVEQREARRLARELFSRYKQGDKRLGFRYDPRAVLRLQLRRGLPLESAEALADLAAERERHDAKIRIGSGGPKAKAVPLHYFDWLHAWDRLAPKARTHRCDFAGDCGRFGTHRLRVDGIVVGYYCPEHARKFNGDALERLGLSERQAALMIARDDFHGHPERWEYDPGEAPENAAALVIYGVGAARKALQKGISQTRAA